MYTSLNDASERCPNLAPGDVEVWYMRPDWFRRGIQGDRPDPAKLSETHILLGKVSGKCREMLWCSLQGENWSPEGEARSMLLSLGLEHTSMSVGDVVKDGKTYVVDCMGFAEI